MKYGFIVIFEKAAKFEIQCRLLQIIGGALWVKALIELEWTTIP